MERQTAGNEAKGMQPESGGETIRLVWELVAAGQQVSPKDRFHEGYLIYIHMISMSNPRSFQSVHGKTTQGF